MANFKLASCSSIVSAGAESHVRTSTADKVIDATIAGAVEHATVIEVGPAGNDEECGGRSPGFAEESRFSEWDDGIGSAEEAAESVNALPNRGDGCAGACIVLGFEELEEIDLC